MNGFRNALPGLLTAFAYGLLFYGLSVFPISRVMGYAQVPAALLLLGLCVAFFLLRRHCNVFTLFVLAHVVLLLAIFLGTHLLAFPLYERLAVLACAICLLLFSFQQRLSKQSGGFPLPGFFACGGLLFLCAALLVQAGGPRLYVPYTMFTLLLFLMHLLWQHLTALSDALSTIQLQTDKQKKSIRRSNNRSIAALMAATATIAIALLPLHRLLKSLFQSLRSGIIWLLRKLFSRSSTPPTPEAPVAPDVSPQLPDAPFQDNLPVRKPLLTPEMIQAIVVLVLLGSALFLVWYGFRHMHRRFGAVIDDTGDRKESLGAVDRDEVPGPWYSPRKRRAPGSRIRLLFYRRVRAHHRRNRLTISPSETAADLSVRVPDTDVLLPQYEAARYGPLGDKPPADLDQTKFS